MLEFHLKYQAELYESNLYKEIEKTFPKLEKFFTNETLLRFANTPITNLSKYNLGLGTMVRLKLLRPRSILYKKFVEHDFTDKNMMAMIIIGEFYKSISRF